MPNWKRSLCSCLVSLRHNACYRKLYTKFLEKYLSFADVTRSHSVDKGMADTFFS